MGWELTLACLSIMPFSLGASILLTNYQTKSSMLEMKSYSQAGKQAEEVLKSIRTIVAFNGESKEVAKYSRLLQPAEKQGRKRGLYSGLGNGFNWILTYSLNTIGLMYGTRLIVQSFDKDADDNRYVVGVVFSILFNTYMATQSITFCVPHAEVFASARGAAASIFYLLDRQPKIDSLQTGGLCPRRVTGDICLEDIHFNYPSRTEVKILKGFSLRIKAGECVALVDGKDIKSLNLGWLRSCLGVVGQEPVLFRGTIFDNIAIGVPDATLTAVQRVAEMAYAHDFITKLPNGYDTVIGERGASLSGGQKQRIAIARSLLREPAVLLLDEATSALDPNSERQVQIALDRASVGRTTISVSHRLSTIINADRIICMDQGAIVEEGTHKELMKKQGFYYKLVTTGKENKDVEEIEILSEGGDGEQNINDQITVSRTDLKRKSTKSTRQIHGQSVTRGSQDWMTPRGSFASVMSAGLQNFAYNSKHEETDEDEQLKPLSNLEILKLNSPEWVLIVIGSIAAFVQGVCFPAFALIFGFSSGIFVLTDRDQIIYYADLYSGMFILVAAVAGISMCLQSFTFTTAGLKMTTRLRVKYFTALLAQEIGYFDRESNTVGAMCARLSGDAAEVQGATGLRIGLILQGISSVFVGFIMAMCYNWKLTLVGTVFLPLMVGSIWLEGIVSQQSQSDERAAMESATAIATEAVVSIRTVQSLGVESTFLGKFEEGLVEACSAIIKKARWRGLVLGSGVYVPFMAFGSATVYGTVLVSRGEMEYRIVLLVNMALMYGAYMLGQSLSYAPGVNSAKAAASRIVSVITRVPKVRTEDGIKDKLDWVASGSFSVNNVEFCYPTRPNQKILKGINLKVEVGMTVALVGSSGCGKSTVLQLMQRFYDPDTGNIELDGRDIKNIVNIAEAAKAARCSATGTSVV
ncbi:unnamed protein product [Arctia plantaginis]|uniref:Uncharacterized protein n=1 Tax=Arctia plantaginis TaxID=874455 RepID=A0A8S0ZQL5_ARCPL|nr:unnamed protein product [Arctia plantaginis]